MNELIGIMADDMHIEQYSGESIDSYGYRVIYSALGLWCLKSALNEKDNKVGISKKAQSRLLHDLVEQYIEMCPTAKHFLYSSRNTDIAVFVRNIYEQTGCLLTNENNYNTLNNDGETVRFSDHDFLYLGLPENEHLINGLGIHVPYSNHAMELNDFLIRDELTVEEYIKANFDECDFDKRDISSESLEYFNPFYYGNLSKSWHGRIKADITMARKSPIGPYYKVLRQADGTLLYADENNSEDLDLMTGAEFRRLYVALKQHYENPMQLLVCPIDNTYTYLRILGQLPNREYFYLLLNAWPRNGFVDRNNFIIRNELTAQTAEVLKKIGFVVRNGEFYG